MDEGNSHSRAPRQTGTGTLCLIHPSKASPRIPPFPHLSVMFAAHLQGSQGARAGQSHFLGDFLRPAVSRGRCSELREDARGSQGQGRTHPTGGTTRGSRAQVPTGVINQSSRAFPLTSKFGKAEEVSRHSQVCTGTADPIANPSRHLSALERGAPSRREDAGTCLLHAIPFPSLLGSLLSASHKGLLGHVGLTCTGWC